MPDTTNSPTTGVQPATQPATGVQPVSGVQPGVPFQDLTKWATKAPEGETLISTAYRDKVTDDLKFVENKPGVHKPDPILVADNVTRKFGGMTAVDVSHFEIERHGITALIGPNGAGKTTTLNMVTGLLVPDAGTAMILGHDVWSDVNTAKRMIGVMPQPDQIFDRLTGLQLLVYSGMLRGMSREETTRRAQDLLNAFDLAGAANTMVTDYSAGMTKKICLASAMIHSPRILVLDEPFESVDPVSSANLKDILIEYAKTGGTVIISSHVMALVEKMCTHVAVINDGLVCAAGTVDEVAAGEELEDRFLQLVGGRHEAAHLAWLDGGQAQAQAPTSAQTIQPILPTPATPTDEARQ